MLLASLFVNPSRSGGPVSGVSRCLPQGQGRGINDVLTYGWLSDARRVTVMESVPYTLDFRQVGEFMHKRGE